MLIPRLPICVFSLAVMVLGAGVVSGQNYPTRPIRIVTTSVGSTTDIVARVVAQGISGPLGQQVIVDNRGDRIAQEIVAKAPPDGYTFHITGTGFWVGPLLRKLSYDPVRDFSPITLATMSPNILLVHPSFPAKSVKELIALAKSKPGGLNYASAGIGGAAHLAGELFKAMAGVDIIHIPYKGAGAALTAMMGGEVQLMLVSAGSAAPPILYKVSYDPITDLSPVTLAVISPIFIVVHPSVGVNSVKDLISLALTRPGERNFGSAGTGSSNHLAGELFKAMAGVNMVHSPYKGGGPARKQAMEPRLPRPQETIGALCGTGVFPRRQQDRQCIG